MKALPCSLAMDGPRQDEWELAQGLTPDGFALFPRHGLAPGSKFGRPATPGRWPPRRRKARWKAANRFALRSGEARGRHCTQPRRHGRNDLQPLRGHALLLEQLPVQSATLQLLSLFGLGYAEPVRHA